jgi:hypothetical protein
MIGRSIPSPDTATRVAWTNVKSPHRASVPFRIRTAKAGERAADQTQAVGVLATLSIRETIPAADV